MKTPLALLAAALLLAACGGTPPPDWQTDASDLANRYTARALKGEDVLAEKYFAEAVAATGGAGRIEETARLWLVHCAVERAMLVDDNCAGYRRFAADASPALDAYYRYLTLDWQGLDPKRLPKAHARVAAAATPAERRAALEAIDVPLTRLLAAGLYLQRGVADDATLDLAIATASERGWTRPLLIYLKLRLTRARDAGDQAGAAALMRRIALVESSLDKTLPAPVEKDYDSGKNSTTP